MVSSTSGITVGPLGYCGPNVVGAANPAGAGVNNCHVGFGLGDRKRSYCRSERSTTSPTPIRRATGASADGSNTPSCMRRSSAINRSVDAGDP